MCSSSSSCRSIPSTAFLTREGSHVSWNKIINYHPDDEKLRHLPCPALQTVSDPQSQVPNALERVATNLPRCLGVLVDAISLDSSGSKEVKQTPNMMSPMSLTSMALKLLLDWECYPAGSFHNSLFSVRAC